MFVFFCLHEIVSDGGVCILCLLPFLQILLEAIRGRSYTGDIAIDDITFSNSSSCTLTPAAARVTTPAPPSTTTIAPATIPSMSMFDSHRDCLPLHCPTTVSHCVIKLEAWLWVCANGNTGKTFERCGGVHIGFLECTAAWSKQSRMINCLTNQGSHWHGPVIASTL